MRSGFKEYNLNLFDNAVSLKAHCLLKRQDKRVVSLEIEITEKKHSTVNIVLASKSSTINIVIAFKSLEMDLYVLQTLYTKS